MERYCTKCEKLLNANERFCSNCGTENVHDTQNADQETNIHQEQNDNQKNNTYQPPNANQGANAYQQQYAYQGANTYRQTYYRPYQKTPTQTLADRERASAIVWTVIAGLQGIMGILTVSGLSILGNLIGIPLGLSGLLILALAGYNGYGAYCSFQRVQRVLARQRGIVWEYDKLLTGSIVFIVLNLIFGGVIGVAGAVFDLFNRNYALSNAQYLED